MRYFRPILLIASVLIAGLFIVRALYVRQPPPPIIKDGVLDLRGATIRPDQLTPLRGTWKFYKWEKGKYTAPVPIQVPGYWNKVMVDGQRLGSQAIGRYELTILLNLPPSLRDSSFSPPDPQLGLPPPLGRLHLGPPTLLVTAPFGGAYRITTGNLPPLFQDGRIDYQKETSQAGYSHAGVPLPITARTGDTLTLRIDLANHHHHLGGLATTPLFGFQSSIKRFEFWWNLPVIFVGSVLMGFSLFSLGLFLIFPNRRLLLYASFFCLTGLVRLFFSDAMPIRFLSTTLPWNLIMSIRFLTIPLLSFFAGLYTLELCPPHLTTRIRKLLTWGLSLIMLLIIFLPPFPKSYVIYLSQIYIVGTIGMALWLFIQQRKSANPDIKIILATALLTTPFVFVQIFNFYDSYAIRSSQTYGLLTIAVGMSVLVLRDVMRLNGDRHQLMTGLQTANEDLSNLTKSLETKVAERTQELAERNEELEALQRFRQRTNAMIIHDLKNPLQVILSRAASPEGADGRIQAAGRRMLMMVQNLLDVDRAEQAQLIVRPERLLLAELVRAAVERQRGFLAEKGILLKQDLTSSAKITSDRHLTERAIDNILHNAVKYTPPDGWIRLYTKSVDGFLALYCDDSGPGVPADLRQQIFTDYASDQAQGDAYGLGLSFVRTAMEAVGGRVEVAEVDKGSGGRFVLFFLAVAEAPLKQPVLQAADRALVAPHLEQLRNTPYYAATAIEAVLDKLSDEGNIASWKQAIRKAMYAGDEEAYLSLLS